MSSVDSTELTYSCDILFAISFVILVWCRHHRHRVELILSIAHMPVVGPSIDRRVFRHIRISESEEAVRALICFCCARVFASTSGNSEIAYANIEEYFDRINARSFEMNWDVKRVQAPIYAARCFAGPSRSGAQHVDMATTTTLQ